MATFTSTSSSQTFTGTTSDDTFVYGTGNQGTDTIVNADNGDVIRIAGANFTPGNTATWGFGNEVGTNEVEAEQTANGVRLRIGRSAADGGDLTILVKGGYDASRFTLSGTDITLSGVRSGLLYETTFETGLPESEPIPSSALGHEFAAGYRNSGNQQTVASIDGTQAARFHVDRVNSDDSKRTEIQFLHLPSPEYSGQYANLGQEFWYGGRVYLPDDWDAEADNSENIIWQFHSPQPTDNPPWSFRIEPVNGQPHFTIARNDIDDGDPTDDQYVTDLGPVGDAIGNWTEVVWHTQWEYDSGGFVTLYLDGEEAFSFTGATTYAQSASSSGPLVGPNVKMGIYKFAWDDENNDTGADTRTLYWDDIRIAGENGSYALVAPSSGGGGGGGTSGTAGDDTLSGTAAADVLDGLGGNDVLLGLAGADALTGGDGNDSLDGGLDADTLWGGAGNDTLVGGSGGDVHYGGTGNDVYLTGNPNDVIVEAAGEGIDEERATLASNTLAANVENLTLVAGSAAVDGTGNGLDNLLTGNAAANSLSGLGGDDTLAGGAGNDTLAGGSGNDVFVFAATGNGDDTLADAEVGDVIRVDGVTLSGPVTSGDGSGLGAGAVQLGAGGTVLHVGTDGTAGSDLDIALGTGFTTSDFTVSGNDIVIGAGAAPPELAIAATDADKNEGNSGTTAFTFTVTRTGNTGGASSAAWAVTGIGGSAAAAADFGGTLPSGIVSFTTGETAKTITVAVSGDGVAELDEGFRVTLSDPTGATLSTTSADGVIRNDENTITGTAGDDSLTGNSVAQVILALDGNDSATGGSGDDLFYGGAGNDSLRGDADNDTLFGESGQDSLFGGSSNDLVFGGTGDDYLSGGPGDDTLSGESGADLLVGGSGTGNNLLDGGADADTLSGSDGNDTLIGGSGGDVHYGGLGNDVYVIGNALDVIVEAAGEGTDEARSTLSATLADNVENLTLVAGSAAVDGTGNGLDNVLTGNEAANSLSGLGGNDTLAGGAGNDTLTGGAVTDTFLVESGGGHDTITDFEAGTGGDLLDVSALGITDFSEVMSYASQDGGDTVFDFSSGHSVRMEDVASSALGSGNFVYAPQAMAAEAASGSSGGSEASALRLLDAMAAFDPPAAGSVTPQPEEPRSIAEMLAAFHAA